MYNLWASVTDFMLIKEIKNNTIYCKNEKSQYVPYSKHCYFHSIALSYVNLCLHRNLHEETKINNFSE